MRNAIKQYARRRRNAFSPTAPQLPSRPPSPHTPWSGCGSWRPGGAGHCTNDLDAMGRVCSALPEAMVDGNGSPTHATMGPRRERRPLHPGSRPIPRRRHCSVPRPVHRVLALWPRPYPCVGGRRRSGPRLGAAAPSEPGSPPGGAERAALMGAGEVQSLRSAMIAVSAPSSVHAAENGSPFHPSKWGTYRSSH